MSKLNNKIILKHDSYNNIKKKLKRLQAINKYQKEMKEVKSNNDDRRKRFKHGLILGMIDGTKIDITKFIVKLVMYFEDTNKAAVGTGNIITANNDTIYVLTAAHNVTAYDEFNDEWIDVTDIAFKYNNKEFIGKKLYICPTYKTKSSQYKSEYNDIAIIVFQNTVNKGLTFDNFTLLSCVVSDKEYSNIETINGYILGFPGEYNDNIIWGMKGVIKSKRNENKLCYKIDTTPGQSGSLIFGEIKNGIYGIMGIHTDGDMITKINCGTKINGNKRRWIIDTICSDVVNNEYKTEISDTKTDLGYNSNHYDSVIWTTVPIKRSKTEPVIIQTPNGLRTSNKVRHTPNGSQKSKRITKTPHLSHSSKVLRNTSKVSIYKDHETNVDWNHLIENILQYISDADKYNVLKYYAMTADYLLTGHTALYLNNEKIRSLFIDRIGGYQFLTELGFKQRNDKLICNNVNKINVNNALTVIKKKLRELKKKHNSNNNLYTKSKIRIRSSIDNYNIPSQSPSNTSVNSNSVPLFDPYKGRRKAIISNRKSYQQDLMHRKFSNNYDNNKAFNPNNVPLPKGWLKRVSKNGTPYYYNFKTGKSYWKHPCDPEFSEI